MRTFVRLALAGSACLALSGVLIAQSGADRIRPEALRAHLWFLADDLLEGRNTGTRGYDIAAQYVAAQFAAYGLRPAGGDGTYFQSVPIRRAEIVESTVSLAGPAGTTALASPKDYVVRPDVRRDTLSASGPVVFVGYGISAPEYELDEYGGIDVRGKIVAFLRSGGESLPPTARAIHSSVATKLEVAAARGAVGAFYVIQPTFPMPTNERFDWVDTAGGDSGAPASLGPVVTITEAAAAPFFRSVGSVDEIKARLKAGTLRAFDTKVTATITATGRSAALRTANVVGLLEGSDPVRAREHVVYTSHLDHVGIGTPVNGDAIYNGAIDNASGIATMLEVTRAQSARPRRPRSVLFVAVTGEERGLLGSDYFARHPTVPPASLFANVNSDGSNMLIPAIKDFVAYGAPESRGMEAIVAEVAATLRLKVSPDPVPEETYFVRSDQFSFVKQGLAALFIMPGLDSREAMARFNKERYHKPADDLTQPFHFEAGATWATIQLEVLDRLLTTSSRPGLNPDDFLGRRYPRTKG